MTFITDIFQFNRQRKHRKVKQNKMKRGRFKSKSIFPYLQSSTLFRDETHMIIPSSVYLQPIFLHPLCLRRPTLKKHFNPLLLQQSIEQQPHSGYK